ncbi:MAG: ABC transporter ATP-binding protein [Candidatus Methanomethylicia archaeon]
MVELLKTVNLKKYFPVKSGFLSKPIYIRAVDDVNISIKPSEVVALVGESGSGKTTLGRVMIGLMKPDSGNVFFKGKDIYKLKGREYIEARHKLQIIFQNPDSSINPRMQVVDVIGEAIKELNPKLSSREILDEVLRLLETVALSPDHIYKYPHELSGGEKQRVVIARVIAVKPEVIVADEPTSALDISIRSQILNLLMDLQKAIGISLIFITHDLGIVWSISDRVAIMYMGKIVELSETEEIFSNPLHPYTKMLIASSPSTPIKITDPTFKPRGEPPSLINPPRGCIFITRCPIATEKCLINSPPLIEASRNHYVACIRNN